MWGKAQARSFAVQAGVGADKGFGAVGLFVIGFVLLVRGLLAGTTQSAYAPKPLLFLPGKFFLKTIYKKCDGQIAVVTSQARTL